MAVSFNSSGFGGSASGDEDNAQLSVLADAIRKMDGLIGDFRAASPDVPEPVLSTNPTVLAIVDVSEQLADLINQLKQIDVSDIPHPRECVPASVQETIISWLGGINLEETQQLIHDKDELLGQVVSLQQQLEGTRGECLKLSSKVSNAEKRCVERDQQLRDVNEDMRVTKISLSTKEVELRHLQDQIQAGIRADKLPRGSKQVSFTPSTNPQTAPHRKSFRRALKNAFGKKDRDVAALTPASSQKWLSNPRADTFTAKSSTELAEWFRNIGLDMYSDLTEEKVLTGESLAEMVVEDSSLLVHIGILSTLHCKKLKLAVKDALCERPSCLSELNHEWVGQWLVDIGLPQFQRVFLDARFDGLMLNSITHEDLKLLDVVVPFHVASIKCALQAFRMCAYDKNYFSTEKKLGSQKLLRWSAKDVARWICSIELDDYVGAMENMGIHGAVMLLDVRFSSESLARALGISQSKTLIRKHLSKKFMELIGPVAAQNKVDAMQNKSFVPLDPTETPTGFNRHRSRSVGHRRGKSDKEVPKPLLPMNKFPASSKGVPGHMGDLAAASSRASADQSSGVVLSPKLESHPPSQHHHSFDLSSAEAVRYPSP